MLHSTAYDSIIASLGSFCFCFRFPFLFLNLPLPIHCSLYSEYFKRDMSPTGPINVCDTFLLKDMVFPCEKTQ